MKLVIAEKPSVAQSLAKVLGADKRWAGYLEGNGYIVSWCLGHLVELAQPETYDAGYAKWKTADLPILPADWKYQASASTEKQFAVLQKLMNREDVKSLVCATDAGKEGELIFRLVYHQCCCTKPFERLWISSMEDAAIREGFENLRPSADYDLLYAAALCRERADWIVGINATRLFSCLYHQTLNVGRVMTPTLAMIVQREAEIAGFQAKPFYTVQLQFPGFHVSTERIADMQEAERILAVINKEASGKALVKEMRKVEKTEKAPALYDLTGLQRDANRLLGFTAQQTLDYAQSLYEKKMITYPRTDSRYLTEDMRETLPELICSTAERFDVSATIRGMTVSSRENYSQVINGKKVTDHHAIIPTKTCGDTDVSELPSGELQILVMISCRLLAAVSNPCHYMETSLTLECAGQKFTAKGKQVTDEGWRAVEQFFYPRNASQEKTDRKENGPDPGEDDNFFTFSELKEGEMVSFTDAVIREGKTTAPGHFTENTLLSAMENAGADETPDEAERKGLGTPATRAGIIEKLVQKGFVERKGSKKTRYLVSTEKGNTLIRVVPEMLKSPFMTAEWEQKLLKIEKEDYQAEQFMTEISGQVSGLIRTYEVIPEERDRLSSPHSIGSCPCCHSPVTERKKGWFCSNENCRFALWKDNSFFTGIGKNLTAELAGALLKDGQVYLLNCKSRKTGKNYDAMLVMSTGEDGKASFSFDFSKGPGKKNGKKGKG